MDTGILISVVIPVYNGESFIKRTLDSVYQQTLKPYELVMVDDGSNDNTVQIIKDYYRSHSGIIDKTKLIEQSNRGAGAARNTGVQNATGNWIAFLDSDDVWDKEKVKETYEAIRLNPNAKIVSHNMYVVENGDYAHKKYAESHKKYDRKRPLFVQLYHTPFLATSCVTIRKDLISEVGMFDTTLPSCQDWDLWLKSSLKMNEAENLIIIDKGLSTYLIREGSISYNIKNRYECGIVVLLRYRDELDNYFEEKQKREAVRQAVNLFVFGEAYNALKHIRILKCSRLLLWYCRDLIIRRI